ncbi:MAG TPA: hypothetical protein VEA92_03535 [Candidatus Paceibacterota bacterium]|nr:hypothetical protein [Candidatus Paceibacterota bacterium]
MKLTKTTTILLLILGAVAVVSGVVIYNATSSVPSDEEILTEEVGMSNVDEALFMNLASQIDAIRFDEAFFSDPRFLTLVDIRVVVVPEQVGRKDPFANLSGIVPTQ